MSAIPLPERRHWYEDEGQRLQSDVSAVSFVAREASSLFADCFYAPFRNGLIIKFEELADGSAFFFDLDANSLTFNSTALDSVMDAVESAIATKTLATVPDSLIRRLAFRKYLLHEIYHISQGMTRYHVVGVLKSMSEQRLIARFDLVADRAAMHAFDPDRADNRRFFRLYREHCELALKLDGEIFFRTFDFSPDRREKNHRALGLTLMATRFALFHDGKDWTPFETEMPSLDDAIWPVYSDDHTKLALMTFDPYERLLGIVHIKSPANLRMVTESIGKVDFSTIIDSTINLLRDADWVN